MKDNVWDDKWSAFAQINTGANSLTVNNRFSCMINPLLEVPM